MGGDSRTIMIRIGADGKAALVEMDGVAQGAGKMGEGVSRSATQASREMRSFHLTVTDAEKALLSIGGSVGTLYAIGAAIRSGVDAANQMERANIALAVTSRYVGESIEATNQAAKNLTEDGLMSVTQASQALQNLLSRGFSLPEAIEMMKRFKDSAAFNRQASLEFGEAIVGATEGLKNENSVLVDNAGVTKNVSIMWKEYAAQHGKSVDALTQAEKRLAEYNGILKETEGQIGNAARMAGTFQGAQAKLNQDLFEFKATLGSAVQPALQGTLTILNPVVGGIRDMVYWVETLGASAGATWDKLALRAELALSGKGMFSEEGLREYERRVKEINANLDATIADIVKKADGANLPDIGADPGKRRQDTNLPDDKAAKAKEKAERDARELSAVFAAMRARDLLIGKEADEKELLHLDQKHREEIKRLTDLHAGKKQLAEAARLHENERADLAAQQKLEKEKSLAAAELSIAAKNYQDQAAWLDKLDAYKLKTGKISEEDALSAKYERERQILGLKQEEIALQIEQETNEAKRNELIAEYWRLQEQVVRSKEEEAQQTALLLAQEEQRQIEHRQNLARIAFEHEQNMIGIAASSLEARLQFIGQDEAALQAHYDFKRVQAEQQYAFEMQQLEDNLSIQMAREDLSREEKLAKQWEYEEQKLQIEGQYREQSFQLQQEYSQRQAELWWNNAQTYIGFAQQMTTMGIQMLLFDENQRGQIGKRMLATTIRFLAQSLQAYMFSKAKEHLISAAAAAGQTTMMVAQHTASLGLLEIEAVAWASFLSALAMNPYGGQVVIPAATAMTAVAAGVVPGAIAATATTGATSVAAELSMAALWAAGGILVGALGEAGASAIEGGTSGSTNAAGYGAGTPGSPVVTTGGATTTKAAPVVNIHIYGNVVDQDKFARELLPSIQKAVNDGF